MYVSVLTRDLSLDQGSRRPVCRSRHTASSQARVAWAVHEGIAAAVSFITEQVESGALDGGVARCRATTRKGKPCQRTPLPERDYCPSHQHLEAPVAA